MRYAVAVILTTILAVPALADQGPTLACFGTVHQSFPEQVPVSYVTYTTSRSCLASAPALLGRDVEAGCQHAVANVECYAPDATVFYAGRACYVAQPVDGSLLWVELGGGVRFTSAALSCVVGPPAE